MYHRKREYGVYAVLETRSFIEFDGTGECRSCNEVCLRCSSFDPLDHLCRYEPAIIVEDALLMRYEKNAVRAQAKRVVRRGDKDDDAVLSSETETFGTSSAPRYHV